jgi:hypothetical protein
MEGESPFRRHVAWGLCCVAYLVASPYFERLNNPNENVRVWATRAVVAHHVLRIDEVEREWGWVNDKAKNDQHVYSGKAPGTSLAGVPVLWLHTKLRQLVGWPPPGKTATTFWLRLFVVKLPLCAFLLLFARYAERVTGSGWARDAAVIALGLGTLLYPYGSLFVGHALAAAAAFGAFILLDPPDEPEAAGGGREGAGGVRMLAAGVLAGLAVMFEYQAALVSAALAVYAGVRYRRRPWAVATFIAGTLPPAVGLGAYHTALFGRPWRLPLGYVENPVFAATAHRAGFHGLSLPHLEAFPAFLLSPSYGLFAFSPVLLLGVAAVAALFARGRRGARREAVLVTAVCLVMFTFLAGMSNWRAGWCVGPRYIATVAPFLMLPMLKLWPRARTDDRWWLTALAVGLLIPSVVLNVVSGALYPHYPETFDNPVFDLAFPLIGEGYAPYGLGWLLHLPGRWALAPVGLIVAAALALVASGQDPRPRRMAAHLAVGVAVAGAFLIGLGAYGRTPRAAEARSASLVRQAWDPPRR